MFPDQSFKQYLRPPIFIKCKIIKLKDEKKHLRYLISGFTEEPHKFKVREEALHPGGKKTFSNMRKTQNYIKRVAADKWIGLNTFTEAAIIN